MMGSLCRSGVFDEAYQSFCKARDAATAELDVDISVDDGDLAIGFDVDVDLAAAADLEIDDLIAARVTSREVVPLDVQAARVNAAVNDGASLGELTRIVEHDPALAQNIGRLARSAAFTSAVGAPVSLPYAIMRLGVQGVRGVCLMSSLAKEATRPGPLLGLRRQVWRECLASALACQAIATSLGRRQGEELRGVSADEAWLLGLLHDFGKVVTLAAIEPDVDVHAAPVVPFWVDVMERHHCDVGWIVTDKWKLPPAIPVITAIHHQPSGGRALHDVVRCADRVVTLAAARGWQIAAADIAAIEGVQGDDEAMAIRIALAKHPFYLAAIT